MNSKRKITSIFLVGELCLFILTFCFGSHGLQALWLLHNDIQLLNNEIIVIEQEIASLETEITQWQENFFYKEKMAREQLQMARQGEIIYYIGD